MTGEHPVSARVELDAGAAARAVLAALAPEAGREVPRADATVSAEGDKIVIDVRAEDAAALRAALNSYLRWASLALETSRLAEGE
jgi:tRNA threonylcarbamoyladenosine modification (KEOPS) complex  Pcc1 subunit